MPESQTAFPIPPYIPQFDGIRAVSILAVFVAHSEFMRALPHASFLEYGRVGVDLFFVLSGFLITGILLDSKSSPNYFRNFYARRALRIWPLYYLLLALIFLVLPAFNSSMRSAAHLIWPYFSVYVQNLFIHLPTPFGLEPTWSLAIEEQFYISWPVLVALLRKRDLAILLSCLIGLSFSLRIVGYEHGASLKFIHNFTLCRLDAISFGSLSAIWLRSRYCTLELWLRTGRRLIVVGVLGTVVARATFGSESTVFSYTFIAAGFTGFLCVALASDLQESFLARALSLEFLRYVGKISYGLYLLHMPIFLLVDGSARGWLLRFKSSILGNLIGTIAQFVLAFLIASLSWRFFETPILRLKSFFPSGSQLHSQTLSERI